MVYSESRFSWINQMNQFNPLAENVFYDIAGGYEGIALERSHLPAGRQGGKGTRMLCESLILKHFCVLCG
jgi:hypothetical protein